MAHVIRADRQASRGRRVLRDGRLLIERGLRAQSVNRAAAAAVRAGVVRVRVKFRIGVGRMVHSERRKDVIVDVLLPRLAADLLDQLARRHVEDVVVGIAAAEARRRLEVTDAPHRLLAREGAVGKEQEVAFAKPEAAAVDEEVADGHLARDPRIPHAEVGHVVDDLVVPLDFSRVHKRRERRIRKRLPRRSGKEDRIRVDRLVRGDIPNTPATRQRHLAVFNDRNGDPGHAKRLAQLLDALFETGWRRRGGRSRQARRGNTRRKMHKLQHKITPGPAGVEDRARSRGIPATASTRRS